MLKNWAWCSGLEKIGLEDFQKGGFWKGELYIDNGKKIHKKLHMQKVGVFGSVKMLLTNKETKDALKSTKDTPGDLKGDGRCDSNVISTFSSFHCDVISGKCSTESYMIHCKLHMPLCPKL